MYPLAGYTVVVLTPMATKFEYTFQCGIANAHLQYKNVLCRDQGAECKSHVTVLQQRCLPQKAHPSEGYVMHTPAKHGDARKLLV